MLKTFLENNQNIYTTSIPGYGNYSFRLLSLKEYKRIGLLRDVYDFLSWELEEEVFSYCYVGDKDSLPLNLPAGITVSIGKLILKLSGDSGTNDIIRDIAISRKKNPTDTLHEYMRAVIISAIPSYSLEQIESWDRLEFIRKFTICENILKKKDENYELLDLTKIGKEKKKKENKQIDFAAENAAILKSQNAFDIEEAYEKIDKNQARALDRRR